MKKILLFATLVLVFCVAAPVHAQIDGCVDSPENPTALLAVVGSAGGLLVAARNRFRK
jgi:XrtJ-associated TM-motif-TM protein